MTYVLTQTSEEDLRTIYSYGIEQWGAEKSQKYLRDLYSTFSLLVDNPDMGRKRPEIGDSIQSFIHHSHIIFYTKWEEQLAIVRILHGTQDVEKALNHHNLKRDFYTQ